MLVSQYYFTLFLINNYGLYCDYAIDWLNEQSSVYIFC